MKLGTIIKNILFMFAALSSTLFGADLSHQDENISHLVSDSNNVVDFTQHGGELHVFPCDGYYVAHAHEEIQHTVGLCLDKNNKCIGAIKYHEDFAADDVMHIADLRVVKKWRGKGFGSKLMTYALAHGAHSGMQRATLYAIPYDRNNDSRDTLENLCNFYSKFGFVENIDAPIRHVPGSFKALICYEVQEYKNIDRRVIFA